MKFARLVWANLLRNKRRTVLTLLSVAVAFFLFATLWSVVTTFDAAVEVGSEARLVTSSATGITFVLPQAHANRIEAIDGVTSVSWANWFGGTYIDPQHFFAQFAVDAKTYFPMYPEVHIPDDQLATFQAERNAAVVGRGLMERFGWQVGQTVTLQGTIFPGDWEFVIRAVYVPENPSFTDQAMYFHYDYLFERMNRRISPGWFIIALDDPDRAAAVSAQIDVMFENSTAPTKTETEKAFQHGFITMWGNVSFLVKAIGTAVFFAILFVAANTMMMAARERIGEFAVLKTLGFEDGVLFGLVIAESTAITLVGGVLGMFGAKLMFGASNPLAEMIAGFAVRWGTVGLGTAIAVALGFLSGAIPAWQAARLSVVEALRRVA